MNAQKQKLIRLHAKLARRVAGEVKNISYKQISLLCRKELNARYRGRKFSTTVQAAQTLLQAPLAKQAQVGRALVWQRYVEYPSSFERQTLVRIEGYVYENKMIIMDTLNPIGKR